ncbi:MAG: phosphoenolpyruvate carboxykinase (ATP) [Bacteroidetes bacterium]|nr:phosphoenolpyruvate carboxykinase (ATP) [Bacteroidota bacterium]
MQNNYLKNWSKKYKIDESKIHYNLTPQLLIEEAIKNEEGILAQNGALVCTTDKITGRSPNDRYIVKDDLTEKTINWGKVNIPFGKTDFNNLLDKMLAHISKNKIYYRDAFACTEPLYQIKINIITTLAWHNLFSHHMFIRDQNLQDLVQNKKGELKNFLIIDAPDFVADPKIDKTRSKNFVIINFSEKIVIIGGTKYAGEIKKSVFSILNYLLPKNHNVLPMHCAANMGKKNDTALFFGLSGTGKTTLSTDNDRRLIGDDEHGWSNKGIFNFEGGCYAKTINLSPNNELQIYNSIKFGSILENVVFFKGTREVNFKDASLTENTRTSYPIYHIPNYVNNLISPQPKNIFFLACDAYGVLPPISKLNINQAMYHFLSGYTAKVAGTENGINEPIAAFQACFGLPFLPLHPIIYANMLGKKLNEKNINVWLVNTGWVGGPYGIGKRIRIKETREIIRTALNNGFDKIDFNNTNIFGLNIPKNCPNIDDSLLNSRSLWKDKDDYDQKAKFLINLFEQNFEQYNDKADDNIKLGKLGN